MEDDTTPQAPLCECGCKQAPKRGRRFAGRACAGRFFGPASIAKARAVRNEKRGAAKPPRVKPKPLVIDEGKPLSGHDEVRLPEVRLRVDPVQDLASRTRLLKDLFGELLAAEGDEGAREAVDFAWSWAQRQRRRQEVA